MESNYCYSYEGTFQTGVFKRLPIKASKLTMSLEFKNVRKGSHSYLCLAPKINEKNTDATRIKLPCGSIKITVEFDESDFIDFNLQPSKRFCYLIPNDKIKLALYVDNGCNLTTLGN